MAGSSSIRTGLAVFYKTLTGVANTASTAPTVIANGINIDGGRRSEYVHMGVTCSNSSHIRVWAWSNLATDGGRWLQLDDITDTTGVDHVERLVGAGAFYAVYGQRLDANVGAVNIYFGQSEA